MSIGLPRLLLIKTDNPESDILGANQYKSSRGTLWNSILVRTGVYSSGEPVHKPKMIVEDVWDAVQWAMKHAETNTHENPRH